MAPAEDTPLLLDYKLLVVVDEAEAQEALARNWGWILAAGIVCFVGGVAALVSPVMASAAALIVMASLLLVIGCIHMTGLCFAETGMKGPSFFIGLCQVVLAIVLERYPLESLLGITIAIAIVFMGEGFYRVTLAHYNRDAPGFFAGLVNGLCQILFSSMVIAALPASSLYTVGILVGVNLVTLGVARIYLACLGRELAKSQVIGQEDQALV